MGESKAGQNTGEERAAQRMSYRYLERVPLKVLAGYLSVHVYEEMIKARERTTRNRQTENV